MKQFMKDKISKLTEDNYYSKLYKLNNIECLSNVKLAIVVVYMVLLLDNMLLTIIVPILPDYVANITSIVKEKNFINNKRLNGTAPIGNNNYIGLVLAAKAFFQLIFNPIVGSASQRYGYSLCIFVGTCLLLISALVLGFGVKFPSLILARLIHGVASAFVTVSGMSLVAQVCSENDQRSKLMGITLGSMALGVLLGYPFGSILYELYGKATPFLVLSMIISISLGIQIIILTNGILNPLNITPNAYQQEHTKFQLLLRNKMLLALVVAIWFSTSTVAILESCLPVWLKVHLNSRKWQLGTAFIPDSLGYFFGTNIFGSVAYKYEHITVSCFSLVLVGISSILIPLATSMYELLLPHFGLGLGIGIIDASLVPLMAKFVDDTLTLDYNADDLNKNNTSRKFDINGFIKLAPSYGTLYAVQQTPVSLAYLLAPLIGSELQPAIGFTWLMRTVGLLNILYAPILAYLNHSNILKNPPGIDLPYEMLKF